MNMKVYIDVQLLILYRAIRWQLEIKCSSCLCILLRRDFYQRRPPPESTRPGRGKLCRAGDFLLVCSASYGDFKNYALCGHWSAQMTSCRFRPMGGECAGAWSQFSSPLLRMSCVARCYLPRAPRPASVLYSRPHSSCGCRTVQSSRVVYSELSALWHLWVL